MKKALALAILGVATVTTAFGQGHVLIYNYGVAPYNQVLWGPGTGASLVGKGVLDPAVQLSMWIAPGVATEQDLTQSGALFSVNPTLLFVGPSGSPGGYYDARSLGTPTVGQYTLQIRASGTVAGLGPVTGRSSLFQVTTTSTALPADTAPVSIGLNVVQVPEPSTFALAGLGAAAMLIFRRRA